MRDFQKAAATRLKPHWAMLARPLLVVLALVLPLALAARTSHADELRFALVIGNDEYKTGKLATPANDAGLIADALGAAGFTVTGARNLDQATLRDTFREFLAQVSAAGPDAVAVIYLAGHGVQFAGENYFVPIDADLTRDVDVPLQALRVSDFALPLAALPARVKIVILDAARQNSFARDGEPLAGGLALVDPPPSMAIAFNAAPGTVGADEAGPYGAYATALTEMIAAGGLALDEVFTRVRLRVSEVTGGAEVPWYTAQIADPFFFTERATEAPPPADAAPLADWRNTPMGDYSSIDDAYAAAVALDSIDGYEQFLAVYPSSRWSRRVAAMLAIRREELIWRHCVIANSPPAFWSYLRHYPRGPHVFDARRRLVMLGASLASPAGFAVLDFGVRPPPPNELAVIDRPVVMFSGPGFEPPPPPSHRFLPPRPREFTALPPPPGARPGRATVVILPGAVQSRGAGGAHPLTPNSPTPNSPTPAPNHPFNAPPSPPQPTAVIKPTPMAPPAPQPRAAPNAVAPNAVAPNAVAPTPTFVRPTPPPPSESPPPTAVKPAPPPEPPPHPAPPSPAAAKPPPPPPPPAAPAVRSACPPGRAPAMVNGHLICR